VEQEIRAALEAYLRGDLSLRDLRSWLLERTVEGSNAPQVAYAIEYLIDEAASGNFSRKQLDSELTAIAHAKAESGRRQPALN
jgi:hypothetical protein